MKEKAANDRLQGLNKKRVRLELKIPEIRSELDFSRKYEREEKSTDKIGSGDLQNVIALRPSWSLHSHPILYFLPD
jgi:hypothetical protein